MFHEAVDYIERNDPATADLAAARVGLEMSSKLMSFARAAEARYLDRLRRLTPNVAGELAAATGVSNRAARSTTKKATALAALPGTLDALASGSITGEHADVMAATVASNPDLAGELKAAETDLLDGCGTVDQFTSTLQKFVADHDTDPNAKAQRQHRNRKGMFFEGEHGMVGATFVLPTDTGTEIRNAIVAEARKIWREHNNTTRDPGDTLMSNRHPQYLADAFVSLIRMGVSGRATGPAKPNGTILGIYNITELTDTLGSCGVDARLADGTPLPVETVRRLACQAGIMNAIVDDTGALLYLGRNVRLATPAQRHALEAMYGGCVNCRANMTWCDAHHIIPWDQGGNTDIDNLGPACSTCHHLVHEGGWTMRSPQLGVIEIYTPDGRLHRTVTAHSPPIAA